MNATNMHVIGLIVLMGDLGPLVSAFVGVSGCICLWPIMVFSGLDTLGTCWWGRWRLRRRRDAEGGCSDRVDAERAQLYNGRYGQCNCDRVRSVLVQVPA